MGGVKFDNIAREWRLKWSEDSDKASLAKVQVALDSALAEVSSVEGVGSIQRVVCGGCHDFKVITKLSAAAFADWEKASFAPEAEFLAVVKAIPGVSTVETQTYTLEEVKLNKKDAKKEAAPKAAEKEKAAAEAPKPPEDPAKKLKKVIKEGGKRGVEIEGAADMGGLQYFCTSMDEPQGDMEFLEASMTAMNAESDPTEEERKGGSGKIGKMIFSAGDAQLAVCAYVPKDKTGENAADVWLKHVLGMFGGEFVKGDKHVAIGKVMANSDKGIFPLKVKEPGIMEAISYLKKKGLFPDKEDSDDDYVFGDDDFPS